MEAGWLSDRSFQLVDFVHLAAVDRVKPDDDVTEAAFESFLINLRNATVLAAVRSDDQYASVVANSQLDALNPAFHIVLLDAFPRPPHDQKQRSLAEEELVSDPVNRLPAEVPRVQSNSDVRLVGMIDLDRSNFDAMRGRPILDKVFLVEGRDQRRLADVAFSDQNQLGFIALLSVNEPSQIDLYGLPATVRSFRKRFHPRIIL